MNKKINKVKILVLGMLLVSSWSLSGWAKPRVVVKKGSAETKTVELRGYRNASLAVTVLQVESVKDLYDMSERILNVIQSYDILERDTALSTANAYLSVLSRVKTSVQGVGFGALRADSQTSGEWQEKLEPLKQEILKYFSTNFLMMYVKGEEVFYSSDLLKKMVASGDLSSEANRLLVGLVVRVNIELGQNIERFLMESVVKPILEKDEALRMEYKQVLGLDLVEEPLISQKDVLGKETMDVAKIIQISNFEKGSEESRTDLINAREGVAGSVVREMKDGKLPEAAREFPRPVMK